MYLLRLFDLVLYGKQSRVPQLDEVGGAFLEHLTDGLSLLLGHLVKLRSLLVKDEH